MPLIYADPHPVLDTSPQAPQILQTGDGLAQPGIEVELVTPYATSPAERVFGRSAAPQLRFHPVEKTRNKLFRRSNRWVYRLCRDLLPKIGGDALLVRNLKLANRLRWHPPTFFSKRMKCSLRLFAKHHTRIRASRNAGNCASSALGKHRRSELALDPERRRGMGERARARIAREFTWDHVARRLLHGLPA
jgi:hypothetical protein